MAAHIKHTRRQMTAVAEGRERLLKLKTEERQAAAANRERYIKELLRVTEWRSKEGVGGFPRAQDVSKELLSYYLTPLPDGTFPSVLELVQRHLELTPEPEPEPEPEPVPVIVPEPTPVEPEPASPEVKTEEDDALMDESDEPAPADADADADEDIEMQTPPVPPPSLPPPAEPTPASTPTPVRNSTDPLPFAPSPPKSSDTKAQPETQPEPPIEQPQLQQSQPPSSPSQPRAPRTKFDPSRPLHADQAPLAPPPPDARVPSAEALKEMMFPPEGEEPDETVAGPTLPTPVPPNPPQTPTTINPTSLTLTTPAQTPGRPTPASTPLRTPTTSTSTSNAPARLGAQIKPLGNAYTATLPPLPTLPIDMAKKVAGVKVRRRGMQNSGSGVNWGGNGVWTGAQQGGGGTAAAAGGGLGPGGAGAQGWWASLSIGQAPPPGTSSTPQTGMELLRWQAILQINPAHVFARRPTKCVTTHEWRVLRRELEYTRAMQRIEQLKHDGAWSFRQPKKQRGPALPKTHWDYVMDEMKWLQVDFREERRWKTVIAFELAHAVREWHAASPEEKKALCVGFKQTVEVEDTEMADKEEGEKDAEMDTTSDVEMQVGTDGKATELRSEPEDEDEPEAPVEEPHTEGMAPKEDMMGADESAEVEMAVVTEAEKDKDGEPGTLTKDWADEGDKDADAEGSVEPTEAQNPLEGALKSDAAGDATLVPSSSDEVKLNPDPELKVAPSKEEEELLSAVRTELFDLAQTPSLATTFTLPPLPHRPPTDDSVDSLAELFPDLSLYTGLSSTIESDPNKQEKRPDESMSSVAAGKLAHASRLMDVRPVLVGTLDPARHLFKNRWEGLDEVPAVEDGREVGPVRQDTAFGGNYLFAPERKPEEKQVRRRPDSGMVHPLAPHVPAAPKDAAARLERVVWTTEDDALLKSVCDAYPNSWSLIADIFNSSRVTIKPDMRTAWDCYDRYIKTFGTTSGDDQPQIQDRKPGFPVEIALPSPGGTIKKDVKAQQKRGNLAFENKKQVRQHFLYDTLRKVVRKRENANKANQPPKRTIPPPHETHSQLANGQRIYTPAELSKLKAERDQRHYAEMLKRRQEMYQQAMASGRPVPRMPPGLVNVPIRTAQMNAHMQMQIQQQQQQAQQAQQPGTQQSPSQQPQPLQTQPQQQSQDPQVQAQFAARMQNALPTQRPTIQQQAQAMHQQAQAGINGQLSPPNQTAMARRPGSGSPGIVNGQAMSHLLRTNGMHQMHVNLANGIPPGGNAMFGSGLVNGNLRGMGPEQMNQLLLQQAARQISAQMQQNQQQQQQQGSQTQSPAQAATQLQVPNIQQSPPAEDVTMQ